MSLPSPRAQCSYRFFVSLVMGLTSLGTIIAASSRAAERASAGLGSPADPSTTPSPSASASGPIDSTGDLAAAPLPPRVRGPAEDLILEASLGYGVGVLSPIEAHEPRVPYGVMLHLAAGYAWTIRHNQSVGVEFFGQGMLDRARITGGDGSLGGRFGPAAFVMGERAHLRLGAAYARTRLDGISFGGIGVSFDAGLHFPSGIEVGGKRVLLTADVMPSWDFLGAGSETLHRWTFAVMVGAAVY